MRVLRGQVYVPEIFRDHKLGLPESTEAECFLFAAGLGCHSQPGF